MKSFLALTLSLMISTPSWANLRSIRTPQQDPSTRTSLGNLERSQPRQAGVTLQTGRPSNDRPLTNVDTSDARSLIVNSDAPDNEVVFFRHQFGNQFTARVNTGDLTGEARDAVVNAIARVDSPLSRHTILDDFSNAGRATIRFTVSQDGTRIIGAEIASTASEQMVARPDPPPAIAQVSAPADQGSARAGRTEVRTEARTEVRTAPATTNLRTNLPVLNFGGQPATAPTTPALTAPQNEAANYPAAWGAGGGQGMDSLRLMTPHVTGLLNQHVQPLSTTSGTPIRQAQAVINNYGPAMVFIQQSINTHPGRNQRTATHQQRSQYLRATQAFQPALDRFNEYRTAVMLVSGNQTLPNNTPVNVQMPLGPVMSNLGQFRNMIGGQGSGVRTRFEAINYSLRSAILVLNPPRPNTP